MNSQSPLPSGSADLPILSTLIAELGIVSDYHHQKEKMAYAAATLNIAILVWLVSPDRVSPVFSIDSSIDSRLFVFGVLASWFAVHVFTRWQLRYRRWASTVFAGMTVFVRLLALGEIKPDDLVPFEARKKISRKTLSDFIDMFLFPVSNTRIDSDEGDEGFPIGLKRRIDEQRDKPVGALQGERLLTLASLLTPITLCILFISSR